MAQCVECGRRSWSLTVSGGLCPTCMPVVLAKAAAYVETVSGEVKASKRVKTIDSIVEHYDRMIAAFQPLIEWEKKGVAITPSDPDTGINTGRTFEQELLYRRRLLDDDIVQELEAEAKDAGQRAAAALNPKKRARALEGALERVRYFKQKMLNPRPLEAIDERLARALLGEPCRFCGQPLTYPRQPCPGCGATSGRSS